MTALDSIRAMTLAAGFAALPASGFAQQTLVVDRNGGAGSQFTTITAAVVAASPGDTVLVRAGSYSENALDIAEGIHLVGEGVVTLSVGFIGASGALVHDLPANQVFSMTNFEVTGLIPASLWTFRNCAGLVALEAVRARPESTGQFLAFVDCDRVHGQGLFGPRHSVRGLRSSISFTGCAFEGYTGGPLSFQDSTVWLEGCSVVGDSSGFVNVPGIGLTGGELRITRGTIRVGSLPASTPVAAITTSGGAVVLDPSAVFVTAGGAPPVSGTATVVQRELAGLTVTTTGTRTTFDLIGPAGASFVNLVSLPVPALPTPFGGLWLDTELHLIVNVGVLPPARTDVYPLDHPPLPLDFAAVFQSIVFDGQFGLSNPATL